MSAQTPLPPDDPRRIAWRAYQESEEYANTRRWALLENSVDGSLWAAFIAGFAAASPPTPDSAPGDLSRLRGQTND